MPPPGELFLSHASADRETASEIAITLKQLGIATFFAPSHIQGAQQWQDEILGALKRCEWFVVLLSPDSVKSMWVRRETAYALNESRYENRIVPVMLRDCDLESLDWLRLFQIVDFTGDRDAGYRNLRRVWGIRTSS